MPGFRGVALHDLEREAALAVDHQDGPGAPLHTAFAPGRCTVVGEHVDYADGVVVCLALQLGVAVALRESGDRRWHVRSGERHAEREELWPQGDVADLPLATVLALRGLGVTAPPLEIRVAATLPEGAGLSSSAALCGAVAVAVLRLAGTRLGAVELCSAMLQAERDIVGVPCGPLDQRAVVLAPPGGALALDCRDHTTAPLPWLPDHSLAAHHTGASHDVGGEGYRSRRQQADAALGGLGAASYRDLDPAALESGDGLDPLLRRRARHIVTETRRARECAEALRRGDAARVGRLMHESHASLRDDYQVSTAELDAACAAAEAVDGCLGARLCGAGFGGTAVALVRDHAAARCLEAMGGGWLLRPSPGLAALAPDVVA